MPFDFPAFVGELLRIDFAHSHDADNLIFGNISMDELGTVFGITEQGNHGSFGSFYNQHRCPVFNLAFLFEFLYGQISTGEDDHKEVVLKLDDFIVSNAEPDGCFGSKGRILDGASNTFGVGNCSSVLKSK